MATNKAMFTEEIERQTGRMVTSICFLGYIRGANEFSVTLDHKDEEVWICYRDSFGPVCWLKH